MLTDSEMKNIAENYISKINVESKINIIILDEYTIKKIYGNIYFYTSQKYFETKNDRYALVGNGPFLVENIDGKIIQFGSAESDEYYIQEYEAGRWPSNRR